MAPALVLRSDAENVREGPYSGKAADARSWFGLGRHRDGSWTSPKAQNLSAIHSVGESSCGVANWVSILS